ncbi:hypothetical protein HYDPIDRAFT_77658 [Hydnomerulius pinastri MD-312]|nr:hypothetical protein HYDPIDRAFT_77658 [Hydnomerulius pinastri MD-312]
MPLTTAPSNLLNVQQTPGNLVHGATNQQVLSELLANKAIQRVAGFMNNAFGFYAPRLYQQYHEQLGQLFGHHPHLVRIFNNSIFPAATFNCGPQVVTSEHVDSTNIPYGLCPIWAGGQFDPVAGGHLILFDLGLVVQFPPGSTALIPSGTVRHGNVVLQPGETRYSFTQYCSGGLMRWVQYGFRSVRSSPATLKKWFDDNHEERWKWAVGLFSKVDEVERDRSQVFKLKGSN